MPRSAASYARVDHLAPAREIAPLLVRLAREPAPKERPAALQAIRAEADIAEFNVADHEPADTPGPPAGFGCPECGGALQEIKEGQGELVRYRCRVGHAYSPDSLLSGQAKAGEDGLWSTLRAVEEGAQLARHLAARALRRGDLGLAESYQRRVTEAEAKATIIRDLLTRRPEDHPPAPVAAP
jgi:two-component system, chemotaxis family, protein-glutamate methylesterase/glutaminase